MSGKPEEYQNGWCTLNSRGLTRPPWTQPAGQSQEQSRTKEPPALHLPSQQWRPAGRPALTNPPCRTLALFLLFLMEWILDCKIPAAKC